MLLRPSTLLTSSFFLPHLINAAGLGVWTPLVQWPLVPAAGSLLPNGKLLTWSAYSTSTFGPNVSNRTITATYDPATGSVSQATITNTGHDMFCPGISIDFNGRVVVTGGDTAAETSIYTDTSNAWTAATNMVIPRGYQSSATCSDGRIFTIGGSWSGGRGGKNGEIYNGASNTWTLLSGCPVAPMLTADAAGIFRSDNHAWLFGWKNGFVFQAGPSKAMNWYGTSGSGSRTAAGLRASDADSMDGNAVMYDAVAGKILTLGGSPSYDRSTATRLAHIITLNGAPPALPSMASINTMWFQRAFHNSVVLPTGEVFIVGGQSYAVPFSDQTAIFTPELFNPNTTYFVKMAPHAVPRVYHSIALLMPDGTVFSGGSGLCGNNCASYNGSNQFNGQFFSPPYLFGADGVTAAVRPVISSISVSTVRLGGTIRITMGSVVSSFSLVRMGSSTHTVNTDQRRIPLVPTASGLVYTVTVPADAGVALPGYWMLFAIGTSGVPSVSKTVLVTL